MFSICGQEIFYGISAWVRSVLRDSLSARAIERLILPAAWFSPRSRHRSRSSWA